MYINNDNALAQQFHDDAALWQMMADATGSAADAAEDALARDALRRTLRHDPSDPFDTDSLAGLLGTPEKLRELQSQYLDHASACLATAAELEGRAP